MDTTAPVNPAAEHDRLYQEGERLRRSHRPQPAVESLKAALAIGGPHDQAIKQMIGVCYGMMHRPQAMRAWILRSLDGIIDAKVRGEALRDLGKALSGMGHYGSADEAFADSLRLLPAQQYPSQHGATLGMMAKSQWQRDDSYRRGEDGVALNMIREAIRLCEQGPNRHYLLYRLLDGATITSDLGLRRESRRLAWEGLRLAREIVPGSDERYGGSAHVVRALALLIGGHRIEIKAMRAYQRLKRWRQIMLRLLPPQSKQSDEYKSD